MKDSLGNANFRGVQKERHVVQDKAHWFIREISPSALQH